MHLSYSFSRYKGKKYKSYAIAESYREGKKVKKRTIWPIGKPTAWNLKIESLIQLPMIPQLVDKGDIQISFAAFDYNILQLCNELAFALWDF